MASDHAYEVDLGSDRFVVLCSKLNGMIRKEGAKWTIDMLSGGFRFDDEVPECLRSRDATEIEVSLATLLCYLWAYRRSLVEEKPRLEFAETWERTKALAPMWAGFAPDRCSPDLRDIVEEVKAKTEQLCEDLDRLDAEFEERRNPKRGPCAP